MNRLAPLAFSLAFAGLASACSRGDANDRNAPEIARREAYAKAKLEEVDAGRAWAVSSTTEIQFEEGFSIPLYDPADQGPHPSFYNHTFRWMGQHAHVRLKSHGERAMKIFIAGWVHQNVIRTKPIIDIFIDGNWAGSSDIIEKHGHYKIEKTLPPWMFRRPWVDLVIRTNAVGFHWGDPPELNTVLVYKFTWAEAN